LTPQEVRERYGHLIDGFLDAIRTDPGILVTLAEGAAMIDERRKAAQRTLQTKAKQKAERERAGAQ
jgi:hypothetical protein